MCLNGQAVSEDGESNLSTLFHQDGRLPNSSYVK